MNKQVKRFTSQMEKEWSNGFLKLRQMESVIALSHAHTEPLFHIKTECKVLVVAERV